MAGPDVLRNMEYVRLRGASTTYYDESFILALMDATDGSKILMLIKCHKDKLTLTATDTEGNELFTAEELNQFTCLVTYGDHLIGTLVLKDEEVVIEATNSSSRMTVNSTRPTHRNYISTVVDGADNAVLATIEPYKDCDSIIDIYIRKSLTFAHKMLILRAAVHKATTQHQIQSTTLPKAHFSRPSQWPTQGARFSSPTLAQTSVVRAAGYSKTKEVQYYDLIDAFTGAVSVTMIVDTAGEVFGYNSVGQLLFQMTSMLGDDQEVYGIFIVDGEQVIAFKSNCFFNSEGEKEGLYVVEKQVSSEENLENRKLRLIFNIQDANLSTIASISSQRGSVEIRLWKNKVISNRWKMLVLSYAVRASFAPYQLHRLPMPLIQYYFSGEGSHREYLF